jgi:hypothetical protein
VALAEDLRPLKQLFPFSERNVLDLGVVARRCSLKQTGLRNLAGIFLGFRIPKGARTSNWAATRLSTAQINRRDGRLGLPRNCSCVSRAWDCCKGWRLRRRTVVNNTQPV